MMKRISESGLRWLQTKKMIKPKFCTFWCTKVWFGLNQTFVPFEVQKFGLVEKNYIRPELGPSSDPYHIWIVLCACSELLWWIEHLKVGWHGLEKEKRLNQSFVLFYVQKFGLDETKVLYLLMYITLVYIEFDISGQKWVSIRSLSYKKCSLC